VLVVNVKTNIDQALRSFEILEEDAGKAIARALNKTATSARAQAAREIRNVGYGIKVGAIKKAISIRKANRSELTAVVRAVGRPIPLINYQARQTKAGVTVAVLNGRKTITHAFIATMKSGHKGVFIRADARTSGVGRKGFKIQRRKAMGRRHGLPIDELFGPAVPSAFANQIVQDALTQAVQERFPVVLEQELKFLRL
jgi:hypothetical protein